MEYHTRWQEKLFKQIVEMVALNDIPADLIFNWDQTGSTWDQVYLGQEGEEADRDCWTAG